MRRTGLFENRHEKLLPRRAFLRRLVKYSVASFGVILVSLLVGVVGYSVSEGMSFIDAFLNAAMLMGGMGQVTPLVTDSGKVFAGCYALYCGLVELIAVAVLAAPILHRFLHRFHLEGGKNS
jgi:hypothetical protein